MTALQSIADTIAPNFETPRRRVLKGATLVFAGSNICVPCTLREISGTSARITIHDSVHVPETFELVVDLDGLRIGCKLFQRDAHAIEAVFLEEPRHVTPLRAQIVTANVPPRNCLRRKPIAA